MSVVSYHPGCPAALLSPWMPSASALVSALVSPSKPRVVRLRVVRLRMVRLRKPKAEHG